MSSFKRKLDALDELGIGVSIYFKLLKSLIAFFVFCSVICSPLYYLYSCGDMSAQATGDLQKALGEWTLGNLGESTKVCKSNNLRVYDTLTLWCPAGTNIRRLEKFGLQKEDAKPGDNVCPQTIEDASAGSAKALKLDLDERCSLKGLEREFPDYFKILMKQFDDLCLDKETCDMYVRNIDWPEPCRALIGFRLQVVNIPVVRYVTSGISNVTTIETD